MTSRTSQKTESRQVLERAQESKESQKIPDISIKIHNSYRTVVGVCDLNLLGKKFEEGIRQLELKESFFKDKEVDKKEAVRIMELQAKEDATFNIVGKESIEAAIDAGIITKEGINRLKGIPFALTLL